MEWIYQTPFFLYFLFSIDGNFNADFKSAKFVARRTYFDS